MAPPLGLGIGLSPSLGGRAAFDLLALNPYLVLLPRPPYVFQGADGSTPVTAPGQLIYSATNLGSAGGFVSQDQEFRRPAYGSDGVAHWAAFDGTTDALLVALGTIAQPFHIYVAVRHAAGGAFPYPLSNEGGPNIRFNSSSNRYYLAIGDETHSTVPVTIGADYLVAARYDGSASWISVNGESRVPANPGTSGLSGATAIGGIFSLAEGFYGGRQYGAVVCPALDDAEDAAVHAYLAGLMPS